VIYNRQGLLIFPVSPKYIGGIKGGNLILVILYTITPWISQVTYLDILSVSKEHRVFIVQKYSIFQVIIRVLTII
jgi:hypothetical protein